MTNTKFRRRALISSVAMLLVALVALGSATFAWFTDNPVASATGVTGKGQTATGLVIHTDTDATPADPHAAEFFKGLNTFTMEPAYDSGQTAVFLNAPAALSSNSGIKTGDTWKTANVLEHVSGTGVYHEAAYLNTTGQGTTDTSIYLTGVSVSLGTNKMKGALCVAVYVAGNHVVTYKAGTAPVDYGTKASGDATAVGTGNQTKQNFDTAVTTALGVANDSAKTLKVDFYVYLDGSDGSVYTDNAEAADVVTSITANFSTVQPS